MLRLCFGTEPEAVAAVARINAIHDRVHGQLPESARSFPAGTAYSARDPALLAWVHATLLDMNLRVYELFVHALPGEEKDRYCVEASAIEGHLAIPLGLLPQNVRRLQRYMDAMLASGEISVTDAARTLARAIVCPPAPGLAAPAQPARFSSPGLRIIFSTSAMCCSSSWICSRAYSSSHTLWSATSPSRL